jgi:RNA polymerase sigma-70 factor (ECF subfamily)
VPSSGQPDAITQAAWETEQLFQEHSSNLMRYLRSGGRNTNDLEDLAQETFIRFFRARCNGESIQNPKGWLYCVGRRLAIDRARKAKPVLLDDAGWRSVEAYHAYRPELDADERSLWSSTLPWHTLSPMEKECLLLRAEGLTFREVAEVLDVSISTAASYVARAIKKFRRAVPKSSETPKHRRTTPLR